MELAEKLNTQFVAVELFNRKALTFGELTRMQQCSSSSEAAEILLGIIANECREVYDCFLQTLLDTGQFYCYNLLAGPSDAFPPPGH